MRSSHRGLLLGRVNYRGSVSQAGTKVTSIFSSLLNTANAAYIDVRAYFIAIACAALFETMAALLPWEMRAS